MNHFLTRLRHTKTSETLCPYLSPLFTDVSRFLPLLAYEQAEQEAVLKDRLSSWPLDRLREEGYCLTGVTAFWLQATQFGRPVASFNLGPGVVLPDHRFEYNISLCFRSLY